MGNLTDDMTRLRREVDALRSARGALMQNLARGARELGTSVLAMRADFGAAHAAMAKQAKDGRDAFVSAISGDVASFLEERRTSRNQMADEDRASRASFCGGLRKSVAVLCKETADDLAGVRLVWGGCGSGVSGASAAPAKRATVAEPAPMEPAVTTAPPAAVTQKAVAPPRAAAAERTTVPVNESAKAVSTGKARPKTAGKPARRSRT